MAQAAISLVAQKRENDIESNIYDACNMAHITAEMIEHLFGDRSIHRQLTGRDDTYFIREEDVEAMHFAVYEVHKMLVELREKYLKR